jgi:translation initiation factor IF-2
VGHRKELLLDIFREIMMTDHANGGLTQLIKVYQEKIEHKPKIFRDISE